MGQGLAGNDGAAARESAATAPVAVSVRSTSGRRAGVEESKQPVNTNQQVSSRAAFRYRLLFTASFPLPFTLNSSTRPGGA